MFFLSSLFLKRFGIEPCGIYIDKPRDEHDPHGC